MDLFQYAEEALKAEQNALKAVKIKVKNEVYSVLELSLRVKNILEGELSDIMVEGEISNFKKHTSGHLYFSLKDDRAVISCVMWRFMAAKINFDLDNGQQVKISGKVTVYESSGKYQIEVKSIEKTGVGSLQQQFELLKQKLNKEGLFESSRKRRLPTFTTNIGVVTAQTGAAFQDIRKVVRGRAPFVNIYLYNARVQGEGASTEIVNGIKALNHHLPFLDIIISGRGGGSLEDLWPFNEEEVARAVFNSQIPLVSAVGHEIDFSIADFAADVRAATPSHAAELSTIDQKQHLLRLEQLSLRLNQAVKKSFQRQNDKLERLASSHAFKRPADIVKNFNLIIDNLDDRLIGGLKQRLQKERYKINNLENLLRSLGPDSILNRGYAMVYSNQEVVESVTCLNSEQQIKVRFKDGSVDAKVC